MNTERMLSAAVAAIVVVSVGLSASTLDASISTDPADAVDIEQETLPFEESTMGALEAVAGAFESGGTTRDGASGSSVSDDSGTQQRDSQSSARERDAGRSSRADSVQERAGAEFGSSLSLVELLAVVLGVLVVVGVVVALAYRYRATLLGVLRHTDTESDEMGERVTPAPQNDVERAWAELVWRAGVPSPQTRTPHDCARAAIETGYDPEAVDRLRRTFEDVQYGGHDPTSEQERIARETLDGLDGGTE